MQNNTCDICGGQIVYKNGSYVCANCGAILSDKNTGEEQSLVATAFQELRKMNFDEAQVDFEDIILNYPKCCQAYWGCALSQYGIKYEKDYDGSFKPTCYNASYESLYANTNYKKALSLAEKKEREYFEKQAALIEQVRIEWVEKAKKEKPYDIFLSYKDSEIYNDKGQKSDDGKICRKIYDHLTEKGYSVFFSRVSLKDKTGDHYEPYIFNALNTAKVMLVFGSKVNYFMSAWVKNEWTRFFKRIKAGEKAKNAISVIFKNLNPAELPAPLNSLQNIDYNRDTFLEELDNYVIKVMNQTAELPTIQRRSLRTLGDKQKKITELKTENFENISKKNIATKKVLTRVSKLEKYKAPKLKPGIESALATADTYLEKRDFDNALKFYNKALEIDKNNAEGLVGCILAENKCTDFEEYIDDKFSKSVDFKKIVQYFKMVDENTRKIISEKLLSVIEEGFDKGIISDDLKESYLEIDHYDVPSVRYLNVEVLNAFSARSQTSNISDSNCFNLVKDAFEIVASYDDEEEDEENKGCIISFIKCLPNFINSLDKNNVNDIIKNCIDDYIDKYGYDENSIELSYCYFYQTNDLNYAYHNINSDKDIEFIDQLIQSSDEDARSFIFTNLKSVLYDFLNDSQFNKAYLLCDYLLRKKFDQKEDFINVLKEYFTANSNRDSVELFELYLKSFKQTQFASFIKAMYEFAKNANTSLDFDLANEYYDKIISYNPGYGKAYKGKICCKYKIPEIDNINMEEFDDFELFELWLGNITENNKAKILNMWLDLCIDTINKKNKDKVLDVFNQSLSYYTVEDTSLQVTKLNLMATALKDLEFFEDASKLYWTILGENKNDHAAHWGLLQTELRCKDNDDLARCLIPIGENDHFQDAITSSGTNKDILEEYIECQHRQSDYIKSYKSRKKFFKILLLILVPACGLSALSISVLHYINKLRPIIYTKKCINQIEKRNYDAAINTISKTNYKEKDNLIACANAMKEFKDGDFKSGINELPAVATIDFNYLSNDGKYLTIDDKLSSKPSFYSLDVNTDTGHFCWIQYNYDLNITLDDYGNCRYNLDLYLKASIQIVDYKITYNLDGGTNAINRYNYDIISDFYIYGPVKTGYSFNGWDYDGSKINSQYDSTNQTLCISPGSYGDIKLTANYKANQYKITYDYGYNNLTEFQYVTYDKEYEILKSPVRAGYTFIGWKKTDGTYLKSGIWQSAYSTVVTAVWEGNDNKVIIDYDKTDYSTNGTYTVKSGKNLGFIFDQSFINNVTKKGYDFSGWYALVNGKEIEITKYYELVSDLTIYAKWEARTNTVKVYSSSGLSSSNLITTLKIQSGNDLQDLFSVNFYIPSSSKFTGWYAKVDGIETRLNKEYIVLSDLEIYPKFSSSSIYLYYVKKNKNDSFYYDFITLSNNSGSELLRISNEISSSDDRRFCGWMTSDGVTITTSTSIPNYSTICPIWVDSSYDVVRIRTSSTSDYVYEYVSVFDFTRITKIFESSYINKLPTGKGTFAGWYINSKQLTSDDVISNKINDVFAHWVSNTSTNYVVSFKTIKTSSSYYSFLEVPRGSRLNDYIISLGSNATIPQNKGYSISQWVLCEGGSGNLDLNFNVNSNKTVAPVWQIIEYSISYQMNGGTNDSSNPVSYNVLTGEITIINPTRKGYLFAGWNSSLGEKKTNLKFDSLQCNNIVLNAQWTALQNTITFNANGGSGNMNSQTVLTDELFNISKCTFTAPPGKKFAGWAIGTSSVVSYTDEQNISINESITLTAIWVNIP